jgi:hypothetical protein
MASLFTSNKTGTVSVGASLWVDLGLIPTGFKIWIGTGQYTSPGKSITMSLRTNMSTKSTGTTTTTTQLDTASVSPKSKTITRDLYKSGTLHTVTAVGTGVEHWWLYLTSKSSTLADFLYSIYYTTE